MVQNRKQFFLKQLFKYVYFKNCDLNFFKGYFKTNFINSGFCWQTFRLKIRRLGPVNSQKKILNLYKLYDNNLLFIARKKVTGRLANFLWRKRIYTRLKLLDKVNRNFKLLINFAVNKMVPGAFLGAFRVKKKVHKHAFLPKNYRRCFFGVKLLLSLAKKNKRRADVFKLAFRIWFLWKFTLSNFRSKRYNKALIRFHAQSFPFKTSRRFWKQRNVSDKRSLYRLYYW